MASGVPFTCAAAFVLLLAVTASASASPAPAPAQVLVVGGEPRGWRKPAPNDETYNHWAARNRFRVGDFLHFKYDKANDSVLVVSRDDYKLCAAAKPAQQFRDGDTRFCLHHSGFFYFLSGAPGHCDAGQRMAVRVMAPQPPAPAPDAMAPGDDRGYTGGSKPAPAGGASVSISKPPPPPPPPGSRSEDAKSSGVASVSLFAGYHHIIFLVGAVLLMCLAP